MATVERLPQDEEPKTWVKVEYVWGHVTTYTAPTSAGPWTEVPQDQEPPATTDVDIVTFTEE